MLGDQIVREDTVEFEAFVVSREQLTDELAAAGCIPVDAPPDGVLAWRRER